MLKIQVPVGLSLNEANKTCDCDDHKMPDVAAEVKTEHYGRLDKVGMSNIDVLVKLNINNEETIHVPARVQAFVSLDAPNAKGIHMSRLYLIMQEILKERELSFDTIEDLLVAFVSSHADISRSSFIKVDLDYMINRRALKSDNFGWRRYPISLAGKLAHGKIVFELGLRINYSSTCPCSAALARQLNQESFRENFPHHVVMASDVYDWLGNQAGMSATPHSQRSFADIKLMIAEPEHAPSIAAIIDLVEDALRTPVQAAVKREDEQEFARLNGNNLLFCEDAARRIKSVLDSEKTILDYWISATHQESLHPHDALTIVTKGIPGGYQA